MFVAFVVSSSNSGIAQEQLNNPDKNKLGILILAGKGFIPKYGDSVQEQRAEATYLDTSRRVAEHLYSRLEGKQVESEPYISADANAKAKSIVANVMARKKRDGLILVNINHKKDASENVVLLEITYYVLKYNAQPQGLSLTFQTGLEEKYTLLGKNFEGSTTPLSEFTNDFVEKLSEKGLIEE